MPTMPTTSLVTHTLLLAVIAAAATLALWPTHTWRVGRRTIVSIWLALIATWVHTYAVALPVTAAGTPTLTQKMATAAWLLAWVNASVQVFDLVVWEVLFVRRRQTPPVSRLMIDVFNVVVYGVGGLLVINQVFLQDLTTLLVTSTVVSAVIGLALQDVLRNVVAGLALQLAAPFSLGDWVSVSGHEGRVMQMNWRTVTLRTRENNDVIVNNGKIATEDIINYSRPDALQGIDAFVGVAYPHAPGEVKTVLAQAAGGAEGVVAEPGPQIYAHDYGDFAVTYRIRYWITDYAALREITDDVMTRVWYALKRAGMVIPFPIRDVNLRTVPADQPARTEAERRRRIIETLEPIPILSPLGPSQLKQVAAHADLRRYTTGEVLIRQGDPGDSLFVVRSGQARIDVADATGRVVTVATRGPGDMFGEMSLLTGEPRSASVIATAETEVITVAKPAFADVLLADPTIAERISELLANRSGEIEMRLTEALAGDGRQKRLRDEILGRIRTFFGMG